MTLEKEILFSSNTGHKTWICLKNGSKDVETMLDFGAVLLLAD